MNIVASRKLWTHVFFGSGFAQLMSKVKMLKDKNIENLNGENQNDAYVGRMVELLKMKAN